MGAGRPKKPGGRSLWIPPELVGLVSALKEGDRTKAIELFSEWMSEQKKSGATLDSRNKPDVN